MTISAASKNLIIDALLPKLSKAQRDLNRFVAYLDWELDLPHHDSGKTRREVKREYQAEYDKICMALKEVEESSV